VRRAILAEVIQQAIIRLAPGLMRVPGSLDDFANERERLSVYEALAWMDVVGDQERFMLDTLKALNLWERIGYPAEYYFGYTGLTVAFGFFGLYALARRYHHLAMKVARKLEHPLALGYAHQGSALHYSWLGLPEKVLEHGAEAVHYHRAAGFLRGQGQATFMMAETLAYQGLVKEAEPMANEVLVIGREGGDAQLEAWGLLFVGIVQRLAGNQEEAIALLRQCDEMARLLPDYQSLVQVWAMMGQCNLDLGRLEVALDSLHEAEHIIQEHNVIGTRFISMFKVALARAYLFAAEREGKGGRKENLAQAKRACRDARKRTRKYRPFRAEAFRYQGTYEWLAGRERQATQWWEKSLELANEVDQPHEQAMTYLEMGRRLGKPDLLEQAKTILAEIGARPDLSRAD
jgi:tetratricopeptide (TPR) repeat protein